MGAIIERTDATTLAIRELSKAAEDLAERARAEEVRRDRARPGTPSHHQLAHSATLWRTGEQLLRARILELELLAEACVQLRPRVPVPRSPQRA